MKTTVYLSLGSNLGNSLANLKEATELISSLPQVDSLEQSRIFRTSPLSPIPQEDFLNLVCRLHTTLTAEELLHKLQAIEHEGGKYPKAKEAPRPLDIDILFFGLEFHSRPTLEIPHPRFKKRLFVLIPLCDLTETISYPLDSTGEIETLFIPHYIESHPAYFKDQHVAVI